MSSKRPSSQSTTKKASDQPKISECWGLKRPRTVKPCSNEEITPCCPICNRSLWSDNALNNLHIDSCLSKVESMNSLAQTMSCLEDDPFVYNLTLRTVEELPGLFLIHDFITEDEENNIIEVLDNNSLKTWKISTFNGMCFSKTYGVKTQFGLPDELRLVRQNDASNGEQDMPPEFSFLVDRLHHFVALNAQNMANELRDFRPNECNANSYFAAENHYLRPHFDDRTLSGPILMNLSLCGEARMTYAKPLNASLPTNAIAHGAFGHTVSVPLPRRCLQLVTGAARWSYTHEIRKEDVLSPRRMSITWRQSGGKKGILLSEAKAGRDITSQLLRQAAPRDDEKKKNDHDVVQESKETANEVELKDEYIQPVDPVEPALP